MWDYQLCKNNLSSHIEIILESSLNIIKCQGKRGNVILGMPEIFRFSIGITSKIYCKKRNFEHILSHYRRLSNAYVIQILQIFCAQHRLWILPLEKEIRRYTIMYNLNVKPKNKLVCRLCNTEECEDEMHFMLAHPNDI